MNRINGVCYNTVKCSRKCCQLSDYERLECYELHSYFIISLSLSLLHLVSFPFFSVMFFVNLCLFLFTIQHTKCDRFHIIEGAHVFVNINIKIIDTYSLLYFCMFKCCSLLFESSIEITILSYL